MTVKFEDRANNGNGKKFTFSELDTDNIYICDERGWIGKRIHTSNGKLFLLLNRNFSDYEAFIPGEEFKFTRYCNKLTFLLENQ